METNEEEESVYSLYFEEDGCSFASGVPVPHAKKMLPLIFDSGFSGRLRNGLTIS